MNLASIFKHYGPGPHPGTGTEQSVHGGDGVEGYDLNARNDKKALKEIIRQQRAIARFDSTWGYSHGSSRAITDWAAYYMGLGPRPDTSEFDDEKQMGGIAKRMLAVIEKAPPIGEPLVHGRTVSVEEFAELQTTVGKTIMLPLTATEGLMENQKPLGASSFSSPHVEGWRTGKFMPVTFLFRNDTPALIYHVDFAEPLPGETFIGEAITAGEFRIDKVELHPKAYAGYHREDDTEGAPDWVWAEKPAGKGGYSGLIELDELLVYLSPVNRPKVVQKHYGPGPHPGTGTEQSVHGSGYGAEVGVTVPKPPRVGVGGGDSASTTLYPLRGERTGVRAGLPKGVTGPAYLVYPEGHPYAGQPVELSYSELPTDTQEAIAALAEKLGVSLESMEANLERVLQSRLALYEQNPGQEKADQFYRIWNETLSAASDKYGIDFPQMVAAAAALSPGTLADRNLQYVLEMAQAVSANPEIPWMVAAHFNAWLRDSNEKYPDSTTLKNVSPIDLGADLPRLLDLDAAVAVRALHVWRKLDESGPGVEFGKGPGFSASNGFGFFEDAFNHLSDQHPVEALNGIKLRSFYNNIVNPEASGVHGDVTVDFHMIDAATGDINTKKYISQFENGLSLYDISLGVRPLLADAVRNVAARNNLAPYRVQEIIWAQWRDEKGDYSTPDPDKKKGKK